MPSSMYGYPAELTEPWGNADEVLLENSTTFQQNFGFGALKLGIAWAYREIKGASLGAAKLTGAVSGSLEWFSSGTRLGSLSRHGGWALYMVDASGVFLFGDWWPTIGVSGVLLFLVLVVALVAYALSVVSKPLRWLARFCEWIGWRQLPGGVERLLPADDGLGAATAVTWWGPLHGRFPDAAVFRRLKARGTSRLPNDVLIKHNG